MDKKVLALFRDANQNIALEEFLGESVAILGIRGSGKSTSAARLIEQLLTVGVPLVVVDVLSEYWGLKQQFPMLIAGKSSHSDVELTTASQAAALAVWSLQERMPIILDMSDYDDEDRTELLKGYFEALWREAGTLRRPYQIVLEEAHNWIPQSGVAPLKPIFTRIAAEGRSRGLGLIMVGQRSARLDKNILTQAGLMVLHRVQHPSDLNVYQDAVPADRKWVKEKASTLRTGEALFVSQHGVGVVMVQPRETYHAGYTPGLEEVQTPSLTTVSQEMLTSLQVRLGHANEESFKADAYKVSRENGFQPVPLEDQDAEITRLRAEIKRLSGLQTRVSEMISLPSGVSSYYPIEIGAGEFAERFPSADINSTPSWATPTVTTKQNSGISQEGQFERLLRDICDTTELMHRLVLRFFLQYPESQATLVDLAPRVGYAEATLRKNPPMRLTQLKLLQRRRIKSLWYYTAHTTYKHLKQTYPALNTDHLVQRLINLCQE